MWKPIYKIKDYWQMLEISIRTDTVELLNQWANIKVPKKHIQKLYVNEFSDLENFY